MCVIAAILNKSAVRRRREGFGTAFYQALTELQKHMDYKLFNTT